MDDNAPGSWRSQDGAEDSPVAFRGNGDDGGSGDESPVFQWGMDPRGQSDGEEEEGLGLMEAFESFNLQAEKRVKELLEATDAKLFAETSDAVDPSDLPPPNTPSYILMSDSYRLSRPPQFHHWRQSFPYLQVTGRSSFDEVPDEHIQIRPGPPVSRLSPVEESRGDEAELVVMGKAVHLEVDLSDPPQEELILADGEMEEVVEEDRLESTDDNGDNSVDRSDERRVPTGSLPCASPLTSKAEESVDGFALDWFGEMVPSLCCSVFEKLLRSRQLSLRIAREYHEEQVRLAHERAVAALEAEHRRQELEEQERLIYEAAVAQAEEEERIREVERREELARRQLEEHDEEEIKIRTLAYSHTREWYQPNKKCFSHRGRQLTYLKPVLKVQDQSEPVDLQSVESSAEIADGDNGKSRPSVLQPTKPSSATTRNRTRRVSSPREADIGVHKSPSASPQTSPPSDKSRPSSSTRPSVQLPPIEKPAVNITGTHAKQLSKTPRKRSWREERSPPSAMAHVSATIAAPSRVYKISPYRIPPAILRADLKKDAVASVRRRHRQRVRTELQGEDRTALGNEQHSSSS